MGSDGPSYRRAIAGGPLLGPVLVAASPQFPGIAVGLVAVGLVAAGLGDDSASEPSPRLRDGDGEKSEGCGAAVAGALGGGGHGEVDVRAG
jgi:hypothetical protein